jgi:hypothetical protein
MVGHGGSAPRADPRPPLHSVRRRYRRAESDLSIRRNDDSDAICERFRVGVCVHAERHPLPRLANRRGKVPPRNAVAAAAGHSPTDNFAKQTRLPYQKDIYLLHLRSNVDESHDHRRRSVRRSLSSDAVHDLQISRTLTATRASNAVAHFVDSQHRPVFSIKCRTSRATERRHASRVA